jgi:aspartyl-tRNA(Asn)/glutamyl-tRNA(Gln) amidotransferase subunit A
LKSYQSLEVLQKDLFAGEITCLEVVENSLSLIKRQEDLNAFLEVFSEQSREKACSIDTRISEGKQGKLAGLCISVKDLLSIKNQSIQASSKILEGYNSSYSATVIDRLLKEDAIILGRNGCDEFGMGSTGETSVGGAAKNPIDKSRVPGGSSSGSAVAVAAGMCQVAIGTDTGGSVRQPASFCGIIGLKPTYSRISRFGLIAYASSFDTIGILGRSIEDIARTLEIVAGPDEYDSTVSMKEVPGYSSFKNSHSGKKKLGYIKQALDHPALDPQIKGCTLDTIQMLENEGYEVAPIDFPLLDYILPTYYILTAAEAGSNLSRFDGVRYGHRNKFNRELNEMIRSTRTEGFGDEVIRRIMLGTFVLSASYYDAYFTKAQKVRRLIRDQLSTLFRDYEYIITPTSPVAPYKLGELKDNPLEMYLGDLYTVIASVAGIPAISIPIGNDNAGLPIGLQVMSKEFSELELLSFSNYILSLNDRNHPI